MWRGYGVQAKSAVAKWYGFLVNRTISGAALQIHYGNHLLRLSFPLNLVGVASVASVGERSSRERHTHGTYCRGPPPKLHISRNEKPQLGELWELSRIEPNFANGSD